MSSNLMAFFVPGGNVPAKQTAQSFWAKVDIRSEDECWEWKACTSSSGYGNCGWGRKLYVAHRVAAWLAGLVESPAAPSKANDPTHVLHKCDNRKCCNPRHFFLGTYADNQLDCYNKRRREQPKGENHANAVLSNETVAKIRRLYAQGLTQVVLAKMYNTNQASISQIVRFTKYVDSITEEQIAAIKARPPSYTGKKGEKHHNAKLTTTAVKEIREKYASGTKQKVLAKEYGVGQACISKIVLHKRYV